jgi:serine protease
LRANPEFNRFQTKRDEVLQERAAPTVSGLIVAVRPGQAGAFRTMSVWSTVKAYTITEHSGGLYQVTFENPEDLPRVMTALQATGPVVEYVEPNTYLYPNAAPTAPSPPQQPMREPEGPCYAYQWSYWQRSGTGPHVAPGGIGLPARWALTTGARNIVVAVLDTGVASGADIRRDNIVAGWDFVSNPSLSGDGDGRDADPADPGDAFQSYHGAHVAGVIGSARTNEGSKVASINWDVSIEPVRVLGALGGEMTDVIDAIRWAAGLPVPGAPLNVRPARIINMSLGGPGACPRALQTAIDDATARGVLVVAAAGNDAKDAARSSPAGCANVLTVAASDLAGKLARYSNYGTSVKILAPGGDLEADLNHDGVPDGVISTVKDGLAAYNGTSMAAAHVSGVAALLLAQDPKLTPAELTERILGSAIPRTAQECPHACGAGLLNAAPPEAPAAAAPGGTKKKK